MGYSTPSVGHYGWRPRKLDHRDRLFRYVPKVAAVQRPAKADISGPEPSCLDQGQLGSCVWNAIAWTMLFLVMQQGRSAPLVSRLYGYFWSRYAERDVNEDGGCDPRDAIKVLTKRGDCPEASWPYDISKFKQKPPSICDRQAKKSVLKAYHWIDDGDRENGIKAAIIDNKPVLFGCSVFEQIESDQAAATGDILMPGTNDAPVGGHEMVIRGYDDSCKEKPYPFYRIQQSWGTGWGVTGRGTIPQAYIHDLNLTSDLCVITVAP